MRPLVRTALLCVLFLACQPERKTDPDALTVTVTRGDLTFEGSYYGELEARMSHPILAPEFRGVWQVTIDNVLADGTRVKKGDVVLSFARDAFAEDLKDREADLAVARASMDKVREELREERIGRELSIKRAELDVELAKLKLVEGVNLISRLDLEKAQVELSRSELQLELKKKELASFLRKREAAMEVERVKVLQAEQKVEDTRAQLAAVDVSAPADGMLYAPYTRIMWQMNKAAPGVVTRPGDKLLEIPELELFNAAIYVRQRDATLIKVGDEAKVVPTMFPDQEVRGKVVSREEFSTTRNARTGTSTEEGNLKEVRVVLELEKSELSLRPGGTVRADISTTLAKDVLRVPLAALREEGGGFMATRADGSEVRVKVGQTSTAWAEVLDGLKAGDVLVLE